MTAAPLKQEGPFEVTRILPFGLENEDNIRRPNRSYNITSDEQRRQFVQKIVTKELTVKEVLPSPQS